MLQVVNEFEQELNKYLTQEEEDKEQQLEE